MLTTSRGVASWGQISDDPMVAAAILDRLLHRSTVLQIDGESYRTRAHRTHVEGLLKGARPPAWSNEPTPPAGSAGEFGEHKWGISVSAITSSLVTAAGHAARRQVLTRCAFAWRQHAQNRWPFGCASSAPLGRRSLRAGTGGRRRSGDRGAGNRSRRRGRGGRPTGAVVVGAQVGGEVAEVPGACGARTAAPPACPTTTSTDVLAPAVTGGRAGWQAAARRPPPPW